MITKITPAICDAVAFELGQIVYRKIKPDAAMQVRGILFRPQGIIYYCTDQDNDEDAYYEIELTAEQGFALAK